MRAQQDHEVVVDRIRAGAWTAREVASRTLDAARPSSPRATLYHQTTPATRYWRIDLPAKFLPGKVVAAHDVFVRHFEKKQKLTFPQLRGDTAILQYPGDNGSALFAMAMESQGKRLFVEADDNYLEYGDELWMKRAAWGQNIRDHSHSVQGHRWIVEHSHGVIVTTRALWEEYAKHNDNVYVCRNSIDPSDWLEPEAKDETFRIGWYASNSHDRDSVMIAKALSWASRQKNVEIINIGFNPGWPINRLQVNWTDSFLDQRKWLRKLDVGVSPLVMSPLAKYRSDLKALEYAMGGAMPFLQSSEPYWEWETATDIALCVPSQDGWMAAIKWAVNNRDEVRSRGALAREFVLKHRTFRTEIGRWRDAIEGGRL